MKEYKVTMQYLHSIGWDSKTAHRFLKAYGAVADIRREDYPDMQYFYRISEFVQRDFTTFLQFYGAIKNNYKRKRKQFYPRSDWRVEHSQEVESW